MMIDAPGYEMSKSDSPDAPAKKREINLFPDDGSDFATNLKRLFPE